MNIVSNSAEQVRPVLHDYGRLRLGKRAATKVIFVGAVVVGLLVAAGSVASSSCHIRCCLLLDRVQGTVDVGCRAVAAAGSARNLVSASCRALAASFIDTTSFHSYSDFRYCCMYA